jgi:hypothetical protein
MILKETQVVCVKCNKVLTVANPKGLRSAFCVCGICRSRIEVNFWMEDMIANTSLNGDDGMATSLPARGKATEHEAFLLVDGKEYKLSIGNNVVGRWSPASQADVQLTVQDEFMSRQHVKMNVYRLPDGNLRITVKNYKNKNETMVNGKPLDNDTVVVADGDGITMADTLTRVVVRPLG